MRLPEGSWKRSAAALLAALAASIGPAGLDAQENIEVEGLGFFMNRSLDARISFLHGFDPSEEVPLDSVLLEDSAFLLLEQIKREGFLEPSIEGRFETEEGIRQAYWESEYSLQLPVEFEARRATYRIDAGPRYYYDRVGVSGVPFMEEDDLERYFIPAGSLLRTRADLFFTHGNLDRRAQRLLRSLEALGYRSSAIADQETDIDRETGAVSVDLVVEPGPLHRVGKVEVLGLVEGKETAAWAEDRFSGEPYTREWEQAVRQDLANAAFREGYPDAEVRLEPVGTRRDAAEGDSAGAVVHDLRFVVERGESVRLTGLRFEGDPDTRRSVLRRQTALEPGRPLDRLDVMRARRRLMALGIFSEVGLRFEPAQGPEREAVFSLTPDTRQELGLRAGWGSYELARVGLNWEQRNPFGRAHRYTVDLKQSVKARSAEFAYFVPQVFATAADAYLETEYNHRQEVSFDRTTAGARLGLATRLQSGWRLALEYGIARESAERSNEAEFVSENDATVAGIELSASLDRRDSALAPGSGYRLFASYAVASEYFGGSVEFNKLGAGGSLHFPLGESLLFHGGLEAGAVFSGGESRENIPFNQRYFPGGSDSVRGYREGRASPLGTSGDEIGAESFVRSNLELEQRVLEKFSIVVFVDSVLVSRDAFFESESDLLSSAGGGLRYLSPVGPVRLEYGHNLNPRSQDGSGQVHFSIGFPF